MGDSEELQRVKVGIVANYIYSQDSIVDQANMIGSLMALGLPWQLADQYVDKYRRSPPQDIQAVAKKYFVPERLTVAYALSLPMKTDTPNQSSLPGGGVN